MQSALISPRQGLGAALSVLVGALLVVAPAAAETVIAQEQGWTSVSAYGGRVVWSSYRPERKDFVLKTRYQGLVSELGIAPRPVAFDVDLGPDPRGRVVAAYSRCSSERITDPQIEPRYHAGEGCDVHVYDFSTSRERRVRVAASSRDNETLPSVWGRWIAFSRIPPNLHPRVAVAPLAGRRARNLPVSGHIFATPLRVDLRERRVAFATQYGSPVCHPENSRGSVDDGLPTEIWLGSVGGKLRRVDRGCTWERKSVVYSPTLTATRVLYAFGIDLSPYLGSLRFGARTRASTGFPACSARGCPMSFSYDAGKVYLTRANSQTGYLPFEVVEADPVRLPG